jgi:hypothetical protein
MPCSAANETDGYRFGTTYEGITPYGAVHAQSFRAPDFSEVDGNNGGFALICSSNKQIPSRAFVSHCISSKPFPMMAMVGDSGSQVNALPCAHLWPHHCPTICHAGPRWHRRIGARFWRTQTTATLARAQQKRAQSAPPDPTPERRLRNDPSIPKRRQGSARGRAIASFEEAIDRSSVAASRMSSDSVQEGRIGIAIRREANRPPAWFPAPPRSPSPEARSCPAARDRGEGGTQVATHLGFRQDAVSPPLKPAYVRRGEDRTGRPTWRAAPA